MTKKTALFGLIFSGIVLISTIDTSAQRKSGNRAGTPGGRVTSIAIDPSDPSGNTVYNGRRRSVERTTTASVVAGNRIGTESLMLNNKNPDLTRYTNLSNAGSSALAYNPNELGVDKVVKTQRAAGGSAGTSSVGAVTDRTRPNSLCRNEVVDRTFIF